MSYFQPPTLFSSNMQKSSYQKPNLQIRIDDSNLQSSSSNVASPQFSTGNQHHPKNFHNASQSTIQNFQLQNQVYQLRSTINNLAIKNGTIMSQLADERRKSYELSKSKKKLEQELRKSVITNQQLQRINENLRNKIKGQSRVYEGKGNGQNISFSDKPKIMNFNRMKQAYNPNEALMQQNLLLRNQNQKLSQMVNELQKQNKKYVDELYTTQQDKRKLLNATSEQKNQQLFQLMISHEQSLSKLRIQIKKANEQYQEAKAQAKFQRDRNSDLQNRIEYYRKQIQKHQQSFEWKIQNAPKNIDSQLLNQVKLKEEIKRKNIKIQDLQIQLSSLSTTLKNQEQKLFLKQKESEKQAGLNDQLSERIRQYEKQYRQLQEVYFKQERTLTSLALQKDQLTNRYQAQIKMHKTQLESFRQQHQSMVNEKNGQLYRLQERIKMLDFINQNESEKRKSQCFKKEMLLLQQENYHLKEELKAIHSKLSITLESVERNDKQQKRQLQTIERQFNNTLKNLQKKTQDQFNAIKNWKMCEQQMQKSKARLKQMQKQLNQQQSKINQYFTTVQRQKEIIKNLQESQRTLHGQTQKLNKSNQQLIDKAAAIQDMYAKLESKYKNDILDREEKLSQIIKESEKRSKSKTSYRSSDQSLTSLPLPKNYSYDAELEARNRTKTVNPHHQILFRPQNDHFKHNKQLNMSAQQAFFKTEGSKVNNQNSNIFLKNEDSQQPTRRIFDKNCEQNKQQVTSRVPCTNQRLKQLLSNVERNIKSPNGVAQNVLVRQQVMLEKQSSFEFKLPKYLQEVKRSPTWNNGNEEQNKYLQKVPTIKDLQSRTNFIPTSEFQIIQMQTLKFKDSGESFKSRRNQNHAYNSDRVQSVRNNDNFVRDKNQRILSTNRNNPNVRSSQKLQIQTPLSSIVKPLSEIQKQKSPIIGYLSRQGKYMQRNQDRSESLSLDDKIKKIKQANSELRKINHLRMDEGLNEQKMKQVKNQAFRNFQEFNLKNNDRGNEPKQTYPRRKFI